MTYGGDEANGRVVRLIAAAVMYVAVLLGMVGACDQVALAVPADSKATIVGGTSAVSSDIEAQIKRTEATTRLFGSSRYTTCAAVQSYYFPSASLAYVATGTNYPDALACGAAAGKLGAPVLLTPASAEAIPADLFAYIKRSGLAELRIAGGTVAVPPAVEWRLQQK